MRDAHAISPLEASLYLCGIYPTVIGDHTVSLTGKSPCSYTGTCPYLTFPMAVLNWREPLAVLTVYNLLKFSPLTGGEIAIGITDTHELLAYINRSDRDSIVFEED